jgi:pimeloyl-ACP methyl ester carboxylesterase
MPASHGSTGNRHARRPVGRLVSAGGETVHVREDGPPEAPPIVLVHGFLGSLHWFDRLTPLLANDFRVIRTDLIGHGASSDNNGGYSPEQQARVLNSLLDELEVDAVTLVGHSLGGDTAISCVEQGLRTQSLVIINEGPDYTLFNRTAVNTLLRAPGIGPVLYRCIPDVAVRAAVATFFAPNFPSTSAFDAPQQPVWDVRSVKYSCFLGTQREKERYVDDRPLDDRLRSLPMRALVLFGEKDQVYRVDGSAERYRAVPNVTVELAADAGHSPMVESPHWTAEQIRRLIDRA